VNSPDVWSAHADADAHYRQFGWHENPQSERLLQYQALSVDLPRRHDVGPEPDPALRQDRLDRERLFSLDFDARQYLALNPDVAAARVDPLAHFLSHGAAEGRSYAAPLTYPA
jgi:serralysin